jgi:glutamyl-Q tRNA(Asp) synthetase
LLRIEDVDTPRCTRSAALGIIDCLAAHGLHPDGAIGWQSLRRRRYDAAIEKLLALEKIYRCDCSRSRIAAALRRGGWVDAPHRERPYPGLCRPGMRIRGEGALRLRVDPGGIAWEDRRMGAQLETPALSIGDFVLRRADGIDSYHLAVVVDDEIDGVTDVVRGDDLLGSTARQIALQRVLGYRSLRYLHLPVLRDVRGEKLSKQQGARALDARDAVRNLQSAVEALGLGSIGESGIKGTGEGGIRGTGERSVRSIRAASVEDILKEAIVRWQQAQIAVETATGTATVGGMR